MADNDNDDDVKTVPEAASGWFGALLQEKPLAALVGAVVFGVLLGRLGIL